MVQSAHPHLDHLRISAQMTAAYLRMYQREAIFIQPEDVIELLRKAEVHFVLMGTHGVGAWRSEPRATQDVDVLVTKRDLRKAIRAIHQTYPNLTIDDGVVVARFADPKTGKAVIDVMKPTQEVFKMVFRNTIMVEETYRIPNLEMALVSKFAAMVSAHRRQTKKLIDGGDFRDIVETHAQEINLVRLTKLAEKVYRGGSKEIRRLVDDIVAGRDITF